MLLPISWLKEYVDIEDISIETLKKSLFSCGFEVEEVIDFGKEISSCVVGKIIDLKPHENSDHLQIVLLDCGKYSNSLQIVTGAQNIKVGDYVPVALHGSTLAGGKTIKKGMLRGVESNGMLCSGEELGITDDWYEGASVDGILILHDEVAPGTDIKEVLDLNQYIFDITITANRPDCQSVYGLCREVAAFFKRPLKQVETDYVIEEISNDKLSVEVLDKDLCPRYIAHYVTDTKICKSPQIIRRRLVLCGHNPINSYVDITNYILIELGQPMHAFDLDNLENNQIVVRRAKENEKITALDEKEYSLDDSMLVICDKQKPVCIAGIMGGTESGINQNTKNVVFESAKFARDSVRKSSRKLGLSSASSAKFSKGVDEYTTNLAMNRALHLVSKYGFGKIGKTHFDSGENASQTTIKTTFEKINSVLGIEVEKQEIVDILSRLNFELKVDGETLEATAPKYREDIEDYPDLSEEVIRMYGYDHITPRLLSSCQVTTGGYNKEQKLFNKTQDILCDLGFYEVFNYAFFSEKELDNLNLSKDSAERNFVKILNPISENYSIMRTTLVPSIVEVISKNIKRANEGGRFFEIANKFTPHETKPLENKLLCLGVYGEDQSFFTLKGVVESLAHAFDLELSFEKTQKEFLHSGMTAKILCGEEEIGYLGKLSYEVSDNFEVLKDCYVCEIDYEKLMSFVVEGKKYKPLPKFPEASRDFAFVAHESITNAQIENEIKSSCKYVSSVSLFDIYRGENLPQDHKSMAYNVVFTPRNEMFTPEKLDAYSNSIQKALKEKLNIIIRG